MNNNSNNNRLVWFRNDLRVNDNTTLSKACQTDGKVIAVYCFDPRHFEETRFGFKKTGRFRAKFLLETVVELQKNLKQLNISLIIKQEKPEDCIPKLVEEHDIDQVYFQMEWTQEEVDVENALKNSLSKTTIDFKSYYDQFLFHPDDIPYESSENIPKVYTNFRKACEKKAKSQAMCFKTRKTARGKFTG